MKKLIKTQIFELVVIFCCAFCLFRCSKNNLLNIIQVNSLQGTVFSIDEKTTIDGEEKKIKVGGFSLISQKIKDIINESDNAPTVILGNSNFIYGSTEAYFTDGYGVIDFMKKVGFDCLVVGHREFYFGKEKLYNLSAYAKKLGIPFLSATLVRKVDDKTPHFLQPYTIVKKGNLTIGIIGISTQKVLGDNYKENVKDLKMIPIKEAISKYSKILKSKKCDKIIVCGDIELCENSLLKSNEINPEAKCDDLIEACNAEGAELLFVKFCKACQQTDGVKIYKHNGKEVRVMPNKERGLTLGHYQENLVNGSAIYKIYELNSLLVQPDISLAKDLHILYKTVSEKADRKVGYTEDEIFHYYDQESSLGNLIADIYRETIKCDVVLVNSGSLGKEGKRLSGIITKRDIYNVVPYDDFLVVLEMTGQQLIEVLEISIKYNPKYLKKFFQVSGIRFTYDSTKNDKYKINLDSVLINNKPIELNKKYSVALGRFVYDGGDGYTIFKELGIKIKSVYEKSNRSIVEAYIDEKSKFNQKITAKVDNRIVDTGKK